MQQAGEFLRLAEQSRKKIDSKWIPAIDALERLRSERPDEPIESLKMAMIANAGAGVLHSVADRLEVRSSEPGNSCHDLFAESAIAVSMKGGYAPFIDIIPQSVWLSWQGSPGRNADWNNGVFSAISQTGDVWIATGVRFRADQLPPALPPAQEPSRPVATNPRKGKGGSKTIVDWERLKKEVAFPFLRLNPDASAKTLAVELEARIDEYVLIKKPEWRTILDSAEKMKREFKALSKR